jgi:dTDP-glucose 4,6-dehydratase
VTNLLEDKPVPLYGEGKNCREWIFVEDACRALLTVLEKGTPGEIYNVGSGQERSNLQLTRAILKRMKKKNSMIRRVQDRPGHDFRYALDFGKIRRLGFKPQWNFERGLKTTVDWYKAREEWWRPLKKDRFTVK